MSIRSPFILTASDQGTMIVNRYDYHVDPVMAGTFGVGLEILDTGSYDPAERDTIGNLLGLRRLVHGDGVVALDVGANIGAHTVAWAWGMAGWGEVLAFEAQEWPFYALAGNIALNNCFNAHAFHTAVGAAEGTLHIPVMDPRIPANFGGLELALQPGRMQHQEIGAPVDREHLVPIRQITLDSLDLARLDFIKVDVEGMEIDVLTGAAQAIRRTRPILYVEWIKSSQSLLVECLSDLGYAKLFKYGMNLIAVHPDDPIRSRVKFEGEPA